MYTKMTSALLGNVTWGTVLPKSTTLSKIEFNLIILEERFHILGKLMGKCGTQDTTRIMCSCYLWSRLRQGDDNCVSLDQVARSSCTSTPWCATCPHTQTRGTSGVTSVGRPSGRCPHYLNTRQHTPRWAHVLLVKAKVLSLLMKKRVLVVM